MIILFIKESSISERIRPFSIGGSMHVSIFCQKTEIGLVRGDKYKAACLMRELFLIEQDTL